MKDYNSICIGELVKITGRSSTIFKDKPTLVVLEKKFFSNRLSFKLFCVETSKIFFWALNDNVYEDLVTIKSYLNKLERTS